MELTEKYINLLTFFDEKKFDHTGIAQLIEGVINKVKEKGGNHQAGCAWIIMMLFKKGKCNLVQIDELINEFNEYCKGFDEYVGSLVMGDIAEAPIIYYNSFLHKKIKGE